jgi:molecular chaperone GrpE (heat shock protein)
MPFMNNQTEIKLPKWPFLLGDGVLLGLTYFLYLHVKMPLGRGEIWLFALVGVLGAVLAVIPFLFEYQTAVKMVEIGAMTHAMPQAKNLEELAGQIASATAQWQGVSEHSGGAVKAAKEIGERMTTEMNGFSEFMKKVNDNEKANLRLELEKLRRGEGEWVQLVVRLLDHTYALYQAAVRSGQASVIEQIAQFQNASRDVVKRAGLIAFAPAINEPFDAKWHHSTDSQAVSMADARVRDTIATGYTYQGKMVRPALVTLQNPPPAGNNGSGQPEREPVEEEQTLL